MKRITLGLAAAVLGFSGVAGASVAVYGDVHDSGGVVHAQVDDSFANCFVSTAPDAGCSTSAGNTPTASDLMDTAGQAVAGAQAAVADGQSDLEDLVPPSPCSTSLPSGPEDLADGVGVSCTMTFPASPGETPEVEIPVDGLPAHNLLPPLTTDPIAIPSLSIDVPMVGTVTTPSVNIGSASIPAIGTPAVPGQTITVPSQPLPSVPETTCTLSGAASILGFGLNGGC